MDSLRILLLNVFAAFLVATANFLVWIGLPYWTAQMSPVLAAGIVSLIIWFIRRSRRKRENRHLTLTPHELLGTFKGQTELKIETLKESYIGKTITVTDTIAAINPFQTLPFLTVIWVFLESSPVQCCFFGRSARSKLKDYELQQRVSITGRIVSIRENMIVLRKCMMESLRPLPSSSEVSPRPSVVLPPHLWKMLTSLESDQPMDFTFEFAEQYGEDLKALKELRLIHMEEGSTGYTNVHLTDAGRAILAVE